jgi:hypothetical protein
MNDEEQVPQARTPVATAPGAVGSMETLVSRAAGRAHVVPAAIDVDELLGHQAGEHKAGEQDRAHRSAGARRVRLTIGRPYDSSSARLAAR